MTGGACAESRFSVCRALHWQGNTHLTLAAIIVRTVKENMRRSGQPQT
jgi:hypothetical protein